MESRKQSLAGLETLFKHGFIINMVNQGNSIGVARGERPALLEVRAN
jgi:hypothetical protein